jgi:glycosyltransferase involved in cell wall biosynthesis
LLLAGPEMPNFTRFWHAFEKQCPAFAQTRVRRLGPITDAEKRDFFASIDIFALPSRSDSFGLVLLEAWANGVPNVAYRAGGIADVVRHDVDGLLAPCGHIKKLTEGIDRLRGDMALRERFGTAGQNRLASEFSWSDKLALVRRTILQRTKTASLTPSASEGIAECLADACEEIP